MRSISSALLNLCNPDGSDKVQISRYAKSVNGARWSLDGKSIYFLQGGQLWKAPLKGNKLGIVTNSGGPGVLTTDLAEKLRGP